MMNSQQQFIIFWENLHPVGRQTAVVLAFSAVSSLLLTLWAFISPRLLTAKVVFQFTIIENIWLLTHLAITAILVFNFIKGLRLFVKNRISTPTFVIIGIAPLIVLLIMQQTPSFFETTISYHLQEPYHQAYSELQSLCSRWDKTYAQVERISFQPQELPLGIFDKSSVTVWREGNTVFFNIGTEDYAYGFACALGKEEPITDGRRSRYFRYQHIEGIYYEFYSR